MNLFARVKAERSTPTTPPGWEILNNAGMYVQVPMVGTPVVIRSWESMENDFGLGDFGEINISPCFAPGMRSFCGQIVTVTGRSSVRRERGGSCCKIKLDLLGPLGWSFTTLMVEPVPLTGMSRLIQDLRIHKTITVNGK